MFQLKGRLRQCLKLAGKGEKKVAGVFSVDAAASHDAVLHLREGAPGVPIWLFTTVAPLPETEALCERIYRNENALALMMQAEFELWRCSVAIGLVTWTGSGGWPLKLAPFLIPPFRVLILNRDGGFFSGTPSNVFVHCIRAMCEAAHNRRVQMGESLHRTSIRVQWGIHSARVRAGDLFHGLSMLCSATGLRVAAVLLHRYLPLFRSLHGNQPLICDVEAVSGNSVVHFKQDGPHWDGEKLERALESSNARWLLWRNSPQTESLSSAIPLFNDARTFAASRQAHFRSWKRFVAPTAPFRILQAGEATRILAPLAASILVDRRKLLALGIPRCTIPGAAWSILFWKAAAAGYRSYSIGQDTGSVSEQPDTPIQDTAFILKRLFDPALRRLAPRQEDLSRGNVSFQTARFANAATRNSDRLKVLIVSPFLPFPLSHGGAVRIYNLCRQLSDRVDFTLIAMREANDHVDYDKLHEVFREVHIVDKDERTRGGKNLPAQVSASESRSMRALITQLSQKTLPDLIQIEYTHFADFRDCAPGVPAILVEHDLTFSLYRQLAETNPSAAARREYERWLDFERKWIASYEGVWTVSEDDSARVIDEGWRAGDRTFAVPNGVDLDRFRPGDSKSEKPEVLYVGSFRHLPNIIGFERLRDEIMPRVWAKAPETRLRVVAGPEHERYWRQFGRNKDLRGVDPRIVIHGFVEDLRPLYRDARAVAVPLEVSAGTNIKVLEAMACGKPIVSTPVGCAGLNLRDGYDISIGKNWDEFSDKLCAAFSDRSLGTRARRTVENHFSWKVIADRAYESYIDLADHPSYSRSVATAVLAITP